MTSQPERDEDRFRTPSIERGVAGSRGEEGILLRAPHREELLWDLEAEVVSSRREWIEDRRAWWIAASYYHTVVAVVLRSFPSVLVLDRDQDQLLSRDGSAVLQERLL